jgi:hypothetical protein
VSGFELVLLGLALPLLGLAVLELVIRHSLVGVSLILGLFAAQLVLPILTTYRVGPVNVFANDIGYGLLLVASVARMLRLNRLSWQQRVLLVFFVVGAVSVLRGIPEFGINGAVNEARKFINLSSAGLYFSTLVPTRALLDRIAWAWMGLAGLLVLVAVARMGGFFGGAGQFAAQGRPLDSNETLIVAQAGFIALGAIRQGWTRFPAVLGPVFLGAVILLRHRTVWILVLIAFLVYLATHADVARKVLGALTVAVLVLSGLLVTVFDAGDTQLTEQLAESATYVDTFDWRTEGWISLLQDRRASEVDVVLGAPFGTGFARQVGTRIVDVSPHNLYLETYLRLGLLGLGLWLLLLGRSAAALRRNDGRGGLLPNRVLLVLVTTQLVYSLAYDLRTVQGLLFGLVLAAASAAMASAATAGGSPVDGRQEDLLAS